MSMDRAIENLLEKFKLDEKDIETLAFNERVISLSPDQLITAVQILLEADIWHLSTITCQHYDNRYELLYHFWNRYGLTMRVVAGNKKPQMDSLCPQIPGAEFYEREIREMFGIEFSGLTNTDQLLLPDDWQEGFPMENQKGDQK